MKLVCWNSSGGGFRHYTYVTQMSHKYACIHICNQNCTQSIMSCDTGRPQSGNMYFHHPASMEACETSIHLSSFKVFSMMRFLPILMFFVVITYPVWRSNVRRCCIVVNPFETNLKCVMLGRTDKTDLAWHDPFLPILAAFSHLNWHLLQVSSVVDLFIPHCTLSAQNGVFPEV